MTIESICLGDLDTNAWVVTDGAGACAVFDCPGDPGALVDHLRRRGLVPQVVYLTHAHFDHIAGLDELRKVFPGVPVAVHGLEAPWLSDAQANLSHWGAAPVRVGDAELRVAEGDELALGALKFRVLHTPGHSPGSVSYHFYEEAEVIGGDVLFRGGVGRWDFPGCDRDALRRSLARLTDLPDETRVRPGHGGSTTVGREKGTNPYLRSDEAWT